MYVSQRRAAALLATVGLHRAQADRLLASGLAGEALEVPGRRRAAVRLFREEAVHQLLGWPARRVEAPARILDPSALLVRARPRHDDALSPCGWSGVDLRAGVEEHMAAVSLVRHLSFGGWARYMLLRKEHATVPMIVTVSSYAALGFDVLGVADEVGRRERGGRVRLVLAPAGDWWQDFRRTRLLSGPGSDRAWIAWHR